MSTVELSCIHFSDGQLELYIIIIQNSWYNNTVCNVMYVYPDPGNGYVGMDGEHSKFQSIVT